MEEKRRAQIIEDIKGLIAEIRSIGESDWAGENIPNEHKFTDVDASKNEITAYIERTTKNFEEVADRFEVSFLKEAKSSLLNVKTHLDRVYNHINSAIKNIGSSEFQTNSKSARNSINSELPGGDFFLKLQTSISAERSAQRGGPGGRSQGLDWI